MTISIMSKYFLYTCTHFSYLTKQSHKALKVQHLETEEYDVDDVL